MLVTLSGLEIWHLIVCGRHEKRKFMFRYVIINYNIFRCITHYAIMKRIRPTCTLYYPERMDSYCWHIFYLIGLFHLIFPIRNSTWLGFGSRSVIKIRKGDVFRIHWKWTSRWLTCDRQPRRIWYKFSAAQHDVYSKGPTIWLCIDQF